MPIVNRGVEDDLKRRLVEIERRLKVLEVTPQVSNQHVAYSPFTIAALNLAVTSSTFVAPWSVYVEEVETDSILARLNWSTDSGTTGELRVHNVTSGAVTSAVTLAANTAGQQVFRWLHGSPVGSTGVQLSFEFRRTAGAGNVYAFQPPAVALQDAGSGTSTGL